MSSTSPVISTKQLHVTYFKGRSNEVRALEGVDLEIYDGEFVIFFGPSGCGKSTLLYSIAGLERQVEGEIEVQKKKLDALDEKTFEAFHQKTIGMIFQAFYLVPSLTVLQNVTLPQVAVEADKKDRENRAIDLLKRFGVDSQANKLPNALSGGQQQRIAIARALVNDPAIILADEPVGNLDSKSAQAVLMLVRELNTKHGKTVIMVTHDPTNLDMADRVFYMKDGKVTDVKTNPNPRKEPRPKSAQAIQEAPMEYLKHLEAGADLKASEKESSMLLEYKAQQVVSEVLTGMSIDQIGEIRGHVKHLLDSGMKDAEKLFSYLDTDTAHGGVGLHKNTARALTKRLRHAVKEMRMLSGLSHPDKHSSKEAAKRLREYIIEDCGVRVRSTETIERIDAIFEQRLLEQMGPDAVLEQLDLRRSKGGAGIDKRVARKMVQRLELLLLGTYTDKKQS